MKEVKEAGFRHRRYARRLHSNSVMPFVNTFDAPDTVAPANFTAFHAKDDCLLMELPTPNVSVLQIA